MSVDAPHLRLLEYSEPGEDSSGLGAAYGVAAQPVQRRRTAAGRPWDELAPWWAPEHVDTRRLASVSSELGISFDIAVTVTIERSLAVRELTPLRDDLVDEIDGRARSARTRQALGGAAAVYLRQLAGTQTRQMTTSVPVGPLSIPARLTARLVQMDAQETIEFLQGDLTLALAWERAAILESRTIGEWAATQALRLLSDHAARPCAAPRPTGA